MRKLADKRAEEIGKYIINTGSTVRAAAKVFGISKSTVHKDVTERIKHINYNLYLKVRKVLDKNKKERHVRGGIATRKKYLRLKNKKTAQG